MTKQPIDQTKLVVQALVELQKMILDLRRSGVSEKVIVDSVLEFVSEVRKKEQE